MPFTSFGTIQKELENPQPEILSSGFERIPQIKNLQKQKWLM
jgi:hypothetical protein